MTMNRHTGVRRLHDQPDSLPQPMRRRPRITLARPDLGPVAAKAVAADLLTAPKMDLDDPNLMETSRRMAQALLEMTSGPGFELTTFPNDEEYDELVLVQNIPVMSVCQHHMLPFVGVAHVGYLPGAQILGRSMFAGMVELHARRPQTQQRVTKRIAEHLHEQVEPARCRRGHRRRTHLQVSAWCAHHRCQDDHLCTVRAAPE